MERKVLTEKLLTDFINEIKPFLDSLGVFNEERDELAVARSFGSRFYVNLLAIKKHLELMDTLSATLIQRYNHEMLRDFFYIFGSPVSSAKAEEFFSYQDRLTKNPTLRGWKNIPKGKDIKDFIPPWVSDGKTSQKIYKYLSNLAHPNMISMRLHRGVETSQDYVIENAITLIVNDIATCFIFKPFRDAVFKDTNTEDFFFKMRDFQIRAANILDM